MSAHCRIGRIRIHGGADLRILPSGADKDAAQFAKSVSDIRESAPAPAGFAIVTWDRDGASSATMYTGPRSNIPSIMIPDFVRNRLLAQRIGSWTIETVNDQRGGR